MHWRPGCTGEICCGLGVEQGEDVVQGDQTVVVITGPPASLTASAGGIVHRTPRRADRKLNHIVALAMGTSHKQSPPCGWGYIHVAKSSDVTESIGALRKKLRPKVEGSIEYLQPRPLFGKREATPLRGRRLGWVRAGARWWPTVPHQPCRHRPCPHQPQQVRPHPLPGYQPGLRMGVPCPEAWHRCDRGVHEGGSR